MKRILTYLLLCAMLILPANTLFASAETVPFFEALSNFSAIDDYKLNQSIYGNVEFEEAGDHVSAEYRVNVNSVMDKGNRTDNFNRLNVYIKFINHNGVTDSTPFKEMLVQANGEIVTIDQKDIYFKLNNFNIGLTEPMPFAVLDVENVMAMTDLYKDTWFHSLATDLASDEYNVETVDVEDYIALEEQLKNEPKEAIMGLSELVLQDSGADFSETEKGEFMDVISLVLETKLFTERDMVAGRNTGFRFFNMNKGAIINLMSEVAKIFNEKMSAEDESMVRGALSKVSLSGIYRTEDIYNVIDNLLIRFKLKDVGPLVKLELNYRFKLADLNKENNVKAPADFQEWVGVGGNPEEEMYFDETLFDEPMIEESL